MGSGQKKWTLSQSGQILAVYTIVATLRATPKQVRAAAVVHVQTHLTPEPRLWLPYMLTLKRKCHPLLPRLKREEIKKTVFY